MSSLPPAFRSHEWVGINSCCVCLCICMSGKMCTSYEYVSVGICATVFTWPPMDPGICICVASICVCHSGPGSTLPLSPRGSWGTCSSGAVQPTQVSVLSTGLGGIPLSPAKNRPCVGGMAIPPVPLLGGSVRESSRMPWLGLGCGLGFTQE